MERDNVFSLQDYLAVLRRQRGLIALIAVFAAVGGAVWFLLQTPMYEARAELALERVRAAQDVSLNELLNPSGNVRDTDVAGATSPSVAQSAAELLGRDDPSQLRTQVRAESVSEDRILRITATDADPVTAAQIADAFATSFIEYRRQEAVDTVLLTQGELDQRASEIREEISAVDAQIAALDIPPPAVEEDDAGGGTAEAEAAEGDADVAEQAAEGDADVAEQAAEDGQAAEDAGAATDGEQSAEATGPAPTPEELDELETLQIRRNALRTQLSQVIARSTELGESADALTGFAADFTPASIPSTPVGNTIVEVVGVAFILGLALGIALAFVRDHFDDVIRDEDDFKRASEGRPVLGRIPIWKPRDHDSERVASLVDPTSSAAEAYRELSAGVRFLLVARADEPEYDAAEHHGLTRSRVVMICSANIGEGKTETAANLAVAAARVGLRTVLVDADLRRPAVAKRFGLGRATGLSDALLNGESAESHMVDVGVEDLYVLPAGTIPPNPAELLASPAMRAMQQGLLRKYDLIVIDTPAVLAVPDALEIGPYVDLAVMVGRVGQTGRRRLGAAMERLGQVGSAVSGTVLNGLDRATDGYYYAYAYEESPEKKGRRQTRRERKAAEAKAKADAKAEAKQAKIDAKAAKRGGKRLGRRDADEQVERTLRTAGGGVAVTAVSTTAGAATPLATQEDATEARATRGDATEAVGSEEVAGRADAQGAGASAAVAPAVTAAEPVEGRADSAATAPAVAEPRSVTPLDEPDVSAEEAPIAKKTEPASAAAPAVAGDEQDAATREPEPQPVVEAEPRWARVEATDPGSARVEVSGTPSESDTGGPEPDAATGSQDATAAAGTADAEPDVAKRDADTAAAADPGVQTDASVPAAAAVDTEPDAASAAAEPVTAPRPEATPDAEAETTPEPESEEDEPGPDPAPEPAAAPARRRSRRKTRIPAAKPDATHHRTELGDGKAAHSGDEPEVEVTVAERPVARVASGATEEDDNLLFSQRPETDTSE